MIELTPSAVAVLERRYLDEGEDAAAMFRRVADAVAGAERAHGATDDEVAAIATAFYERMASLEFLPNSPTLMNAGRPRGQLAACFVVPVEDSTEAIFDAIKWAALIQKTGGGTGFSFSHLRPAGDEVSSTGGVASGPVSFIEAFDAATDAIKQGGKRRGANMGILRVDHPDIRAFIAAKTTGNALRNFNLSVAVTDEFMAAVDAGTDYPLRNPRTGEEVARLDARAVFDDIATAAWIGGDPGLVFIDRINAANPTPTLGPIEATNPCGEQPLLAFESCVLGSINLAVMVRDGGVDWERLRQVVRDGVRFLDDVIDVSDYPLPQIEAITRANRKIGLGVMGLADLFARLGLRYDSDAALDLAERIASFVEDESVAMSCELAEQRGAFSGFSASRWASGRPRRNATTTTVAPTGTISIIAGCSSGIEPLYALAFERRVLDGTVLVETHAGFRQVAEARGFWSEALAQALRERGSVQGLDEVPADVQETYVTAHDIAPDWHVRMQAVWQRHCHAAVSKTVNLPRDATPADVARIYRTAYELGCKGVTVYRDGSRGGQVLSFGPPEACPTC